MQEKARLRMIAGINEITGRTDCGEAVLLQRRSTPIMVAVIVGAVVLTVALQTQFDLGALARGAIVGGTAGIATIAAMTNFWLGYCDGTVVLVRAGKLRAVAEAVVAEYPHPVAATLGSGWMTKKATVAGNEYLLSKQFEPRFRAITGS